jgi:hypothetical protein
MEECNFYWCSLNKKEKQSGEAGCGWYKKTFAC